MIANGLLPISRNISIPCKMLSKLNPGTLRILVAIAQSNIPNRVQHQALCFSVTCLCIMIRILSAFWMIHKFSVFNFQDSGLKTQLVLSEDWRLRLPFLEKARLQDREDDMYQSAGDFQREARYLRGGMKAQLFRCNML